MALKLDRPRGVLALACILSVVACESDPAGPDDPNSRENPAAVGVPVELDTESFASGEAHVRITLLRTVEGAEALDSVMAANQFNSPPPSGYEYVLGWFRFEVLSLPDPSTAFRVSGVDWETLSGSGVVNPQALFLACCLDPSAEREGFQGSSWEGWIPLLVQPADANALAVYQRESGGAWFRLP